MPFDLLGMEKYIYTFESVCREYPMLRLNDGGKRIFINTHGKNTEDVSLEFITLMKFIEYNVSEEREAGSEENTILSIRNLMNNLKLTAEQAMEALGISKSDFNKYITKL